MRRFIVHGLVAALGAASLASCAVTRTANLDVTAVATSTGLTTPAPETFHPKGCDTASGGGGKDAAGFLRDVRVGKQDDFDRVTFEFGAGAGSTTALDALVVPKYSVASASAVPGPKGENVKVAGNALLSVTLDGVSAHEPDRPTRSYPGPDDIAPKDFPMLAEAKQGVDADGHVSWAIGLNKQVCPEVSTLTNPPRLVVDLPH